MAVRNRVKVEILREKGFRAELKKLIKKHGKVLIIFDAGEDCDGMRRRIIDDEGKSTVSYTRGRNHRWSRYTDSCFMEYTQDQQRYRPHPHNFWGQGSTYLIKGKKQTVDRTIDAMIKHDKIENIRPLEIRYGNKFSKKLPILRSIKC